MTISINEADRSGMTTTPAARISALADACVQCGLCLPHCPTYRIARHEAESPRGRIALAQALAAGQAPSATLVTHLDQCLACASCEAVCPAAVRYGQLLVTTRGLLRACAAPLPRTLPRALLARPRLLGVLLRLANLPGLRQAIQSRVLGRLFRSLGLGRAIEELPRLPPAMARRPSRGPVPSRGRIGLFPGCIARWVDRDVHTAAARLLRALGYQVVMPRAVACCGALALHAGETSIAATLAERARQIWRDRGVDTVLVSASGCFGSLRGHGLAGLPLRVREIHEFLAADPGQSELRFRPWSAHVVLHTPCSQAHVARAATAVRTLLARIPGLQVSALPTQASCCGAAGDYFLRHPAIADALRAEVLAAALEFDPDALVTSNVGCRLFLANELDRRRRRLPVLHPVVLLARQLEN